VSFIRLDPRRGDPPLANTSSAKKRIRQNEKRRLRNRSVRSAVRGSVKNAREALGSKAADSATVVAEAIRAIDRAVTKGIMHRNTAARRKSALARKLNAPA
jgi:small subunit ribosomal protein S20